MMELPIKCTPQPCKLPSLELKRSSHWLNGISCASAYAEHTGDLPLLAWLSYSNWTGTPTARITNSAFKADLTKVSRQLGWYCVTGGTVWLLTDWCVPRNVGAAAILKEPCSRLELASRLNTPWQEWASTEMLLHECASLTAELHWQLTRFDRSVPSWQLTCFDRREPHWQEWASTEMIQCFTAPCSHNFGESLYVYCKCASALPVWPSSLCRAWCPYPWSPLHAVLLLPARDILFLWLPPVHRTPELGSLLFLTCWRVGPLVLGMMWIPVPPSTSPIPTSGQPWLMLWRR